MTKLKSLQDLYIHELQDLHSAEEQIVEALPKMADACESKGLRQAFEKHIKESETQKKRLEEIAENLGFEISGEKCKAMEGLVKEAQDLIKQKGDPLVLDAALIAAAQKVEHYEIAGYGTVCTYAELLGDKENLKLLKETLNEEKQTDQKLTDLAEKAINKNALA